MKKLGCLTAAIGLGTLLVLSAFLFAEVSRLNGPVLAEDIAPLLRPLEQVFPYGFGVSILGLLLFLLGAKAQKK